MLLQLYIICFCIFLSEANKIGLVSRSNEEQSSLKTEIMKYKSSECGGESSEESHEKSKKHKENDSDESNSSESDEGRKKKRGKERNKYNRSNRRHHAEDDDSNSREYGNGGYNYGRPSPEAYPGRRPGPYGRNPYQQNPYQDPYQSRNPPFSGRPTNGPYPPRGGMPYPPMEQDPFRRPGGNRPYGGRPEVSYPDRGAGGYYQNGQDPFQNGDMYSGRRDFFQNRGGSASREYGSGSHHGESRGHSKSHGSKRKSKKPSKNESSDEECTSQCVFNNMDIMEDDGIPSESAMIKWAQDKMKNEKLKTAAVKEIRKCFGSLASSDGDNSCNFSKSLASCLKLDLDEE